MIRKNRPNAAIRLLRGVLVALALVVFAATATAQEFDRDAYREVATQCVEHLRNARTAIESGDTDGALAHLQTANLPCEGARNHLTPAISAGALPDRELETLRIDYVGQDTAFIWAAAQLGLCADAQTWLTQLTQMVPEVPERVQSRYIEATQAVLTCVPSSNTIGETSAVNVLGTPSHGTFSVVTNFQPDPQSYTVAAGGTVDSTTIQTNTGSCYAGWVNSVPTIRVNYTAGDYPLRFYVDTPGTDTTLAINGPDGYWYCNDDEVGLQPVVDFASPVTGQYDIFVGTYAQGGNPSVTVFITELPNQFGPGGDTTDPQVDGIIDWSAAPTFGSYYLNSGFSPDPTNYTVTAGGTVQASNSLTTPSGMCSAGWIATTPDVRISYTAGTYPLRFYVDSPSDTTLAIHAPDGLWYCNDDAVSLNPVLDFSAPLSGQYDIFIGTYSQSEFPEVSLSVTEMPSTYGPGTGGPVDPGVDTTIDWSGPPTFGTYTLVSGFSPDPTHYSTTAGGTAQSSSSVTTMTGACNAGWIATTPDVRIQYTSGTYPLRFYVGTPDTDTTLAIRAPDGQWYCNDDFSSLNPAIDFARPLSGQYDIFVGTYSQNEYPDVTLSVTEMPSSYGP